MAYRGRWYGDHVYFGMHYDLHANAKDSTLGVHCDPDELAASLALMAPQWVQTDCKGVPGMTSWFSQVPAATVSPGVVRDAMAGWREATRRMGAPLHCHYAGLWDVAAFEKHPEWRVVPSPSQPDRVVERLCPRRGYLEGLLLPQMIELIDRYGVDGFWVDAENWALEPCYCDLCRAAYTERTGRAEPPTDSTDPDWVDWMESQRQGFHEYVTRYVEAVHAHKPGVLVCSNWLQTFRDPGEPCVPTDWVSGDWWEGTDLIRCEARFISTRGKPWDLMLWGFYKATGQGDKTMPWSFSSVARLQQQGASILALGGNLQVYENPPALRDGRLVPWRMRRMGQVGAFARERQALCQGAESIPQVAVLHSEAHYRTEPTTNLYWGHDTQGVEGATYGLLENSYSVDVLDEWALLDESAPGPRLDAFPLLVAPEQERMSDAMVAALVAYVSAGGCLFLSGAAAYDRFGPDFIGAESAQLQQDASYSVPAADGSVPLFSSSWRLLRPTSATPLGTLGHSPLTDAELLPYPAAVVNTVGAGRVAYVPCDLFHFYQRSRYPLVRAFIGQVAAALQPQLSISVAAPARVDVVLRRKGDKTIVHLLNLTPTQPNYGRNAEGPELPAAGPVAITLASPEAPKQVSLAWEDGDCRWEYVDGKVRIQVSAVQLHAAVVIE